VPVRSHLSTVAAISAADLKDAHTIRVMFDGTTDASIAPGDKRLFIADQGWNCVGEAASAIWWAVHQASRTTFSSLEKFNWSIVSEGS
jgi:hypothetical protein